MSQLTLKKSTAWLRKIHWSDGILVLSFFFTALSFQSAVFLYPGLAFFYQRNRREGLAAAIGTLAGSSFSGGGSSAHGKADGKRIWYEKEYSADDPGRGIL